MGTIHSRLQYAIAHDDFASLPDVDPVDERDKLLTLISIYTAPAPVSRIATVARMRYRLETWLEHTLDQRLGARARTDTAGLLRSAVQANTDFAEWLATRADAQQAADAVTLELSDDHFEKQPTSALFRAALDMMLDHNERFAAERRGSHALQALLPLPADASPRVVRGASWRDDVDTRYMRDLYALLATHELTFT